MDLRKMLQEIRSNQNADVHFHRILALLKDNPARRLQVRALIAKSRTEWQREKAASLAQMAGNILHNTLGKPKFAEVVYRYTLSFTNNPLPALYALFEIAESQNRYLDAYDIAQQICHLASPKECDGIRFRLQRMAFFDETHGEQSRYTN